MWRDLIMTIAVQEMGHLLTVQNLLMFIGGPLNFEREDFPFRTALYPFPFDLEKLSRFSLAKYVSAEMPRKPSKGSFSKGTAAEIEAALRGNCVNRVGGVYERLYKRFEDLDRRVFRPESLEFQALPGEWGGDPELLVRKIATRADALRALRDIGVQGEGWAGNDGDDTHFARFLRIFRDFPEEGKPGGPPPAWVPVRAVPDNPTTDPDRRGHITPITDKDALAWAHLFNLHYRMLLYTIDHSLRVGKATVPIAGEAIPTRRILLAWGRRQMTSGLHEIAVKLTELPSGKGGVAAPPFELPYTLAVPDRAADRWLLHRDMIETSGTLLATLRDRTTNPILARLTRLDEEMDAFITEHRLDGLSRAPA
jgi:hypothetical protein